MSKSGSEGVDVYEFNACRGAKGGCPFGLVSHSLLYEDINRLVRESVWPETAVMLKRDKSSHYLRLKIALAACPNACTRPQIKDIGLIANLVPKRIGESCNGCGKCEETCWEKAIAVKNSKAQLSPQRCIGCGFCVNNCVQEAIESQAIEFRILVGGRMGRHPRWAQELCIVDSSKVVGVIESLLKVIAEKAGQGERMANVVERLEITGLKEKMFS